MIPSSSIKVVFLKYVIEEKIGKIITEQLSNGYDYIYNPKGKFIKIIQDAFSNDDKNKNSIESLDIILIGFSTEKSRFDDIWVGKCRLYKEEKMLVEKAHKLEGKPINELEKLYLNFDKKQVKLASEYDYVFIRNFNLDNFYNLIELNNKIMQIGDYYKLTNDDISDFIKSREAHLSPLAQKSFNAIRPLGFRKPHSYRSEFQRDRERIVHSKAYRRLVDKAQIYGSKKGDHFRTRLTHTLEVSQISRAIAIALRLNEDLVEAIALGHDLGHTPFGHEGERIIGLIVSGKYKLSDEVTPLNYGGFKHNFHGVRVANYLEEKYINHAGLDLTYQVLEGILKHTKIRKCKIEPSEIYKCDICPDKCYEIDEFLIYGDKKYLHLEYEFPTTLEGQIVRMADEIAQRGHDLDDGLASGVLNIDTLIEDFNHNGLNNVVLIINEIIGNIKGATRLWVDKNDLIRASLVPQVIDYFTAKLVDSARANMDKYIIKLTDMGNDLSQTPFINEDLICFNPDVQNEMENLEKIITQKVINSQEVNCFDGKSAYVIKKLFKAYFTNPKQLPDNVISRIYRETKNHTNNCINIRTGNKNSVIEEIEIMKGVKSSSNKKDDEIKRKIYIRSIADYIAGMTDDFANQQYRSLYSTEY